MSELDIILASIAVLVGIPASIWYIIKIFNRFKKKYKIVSVGFSQSYEYPNRKDFICTVPHISIEKYDDEILQIVEAEIIYEDRYCRTHRYGPLLTTPNEIQKTEKIELGYFYFSEQFWKEMFSDFQTGSGNITFIIKDGKGKTTKFLMKIKNKMRNLEGEKKDIGMGTIQLLDDDGKPKGEKIPISSSTMSTEYYRGFSKEIEIKDEIEISNLIEIDSVPYLINGIIIPIPGMEYKECQTCNSKLHQVYLIKMSNDSSNHKKSTNRYLINNWCPKCKKGRFTCMIKLEPDQ